MIKADLKARLAKGEVVVGPFFKTNNANIVEMFGYAGFDFIIVDNEHGNFSYPDMENLIRAADGVNLHTIIRIPSAAEEHILHALDSGASGIQIPSLTTAAQAKAAMPYTKYFPLGRRGMNANQRAANFGFKGATQHFKDSNDSTLIVVHVENKEMVDEIDKLCQIPEIDVLFIGPGDLSQAVGKPLQVNDPEVVAVIEQIFAAAIRHKKIIGIWAGNAVDAERYIRMGAQFIGLSNDITMITNGVRPVAQDAAKLRTIK